MVCPHCGNKFLGKIGRKKFFCNNCFMELYFSKDKCKMISMNEKGLTTTVKTVRVHH